MSRNKENYNPLIALILLVLLMLYVALTGCRQEEQWTKQKETLKLSQPTSMADYPPYTDWRWYTTYADGTGVTHSFTAHSLRMMRWLHIDTTNTGNSENIVDCQS